MEHKSLVKIRVTRKGNGQPIAGYTVEVIAVMHENEEDNITDADGYIKPFYMDMNDYVYADVFVRDPNENMVVEADRQYVLTSPETIINIEV